MPDKKRWIRSVEQAALAPLPLPWARSSGETPSDGPNDIPIDQSTPDD